MEQGAELELGAGRELRKLGAWSRELRSYELGARSWELRSPEKGDRCRLLHAAWFLLHALCSMLHADGASVAVPPLSSR